MHISITPIPVAAVAEAWPVLEPLLAPAVEHDERRSMADVFEHIAIGRILPFNMGVGAAEAVLLLEPSEVGGLMTLWVYALAGRIGAPPRQMVQIVREGIAAIEQLARNAGYHEIRFGGRDWSFALPDYEQAGETPDMLRKVL